MIKRIVVLAIACVAWLAMAAELTPAAEAEITHLNDYLLASHCEFNRNGTWYNAADAVAHLKFKVEFLNSIGELGSSEDFIKKVASESSASGKPYLVRCTSAGLVTTSETGPWFRTELARYRDGVKAKPK